MVSLLSHGHLVIMRRWWNIQGPILYRAFPGLGLSPMLWKGNMPQVFVKTFSSHSPQRQSQNTVQQMSNLPGCQHWHKIKVLTIGQWFYMFFSYLVYSSTCIQWSPMVQSKWALIKNQLIQIISTGWFVIKCWRSCTYKLVN